MRSLGKFHSFPADAAPVVSETGFFLPDSRLEAPQILLPRTTPTGRLAVDFEAAQNFGVNQGLTEVAVAGQDRTLIQNHPILWSDDTWATKTGFAKQTDAYIPLLKGENVEGWQYGSILLCGRWLTSSEAWHTIFAVTKQNAVYWTDVEQIFMGNTATHSNTATAIMVTHNSNQKTIRSHGSTAGNPSGFIYGRWDVSTALTSDNIFSVYQSAINQWLDSRRVGLTNTWFTGDYAELRLPNIGCKFAMTHAFLWTGNQIGSAKAREIYNNPNRFLVPA